MKEDVHKLFKLRKEKFMAVIRRDKLNQLRLVTERADEEEEAELGKIKREARNEDEEVFRKM